MSLVVFTPEAEDDLAEIWAHIAEWNPANATRFIRRLRDRCRWLAGAPFAGRARTELHAGLRSWAVDSYIVYYFPDEHGIRIAHVFHGSRDPEGLF